jgi:hypothetical protein
MGVENIKLTLTHDEALVLFEWLSVHDESERIPVGDTAERLALWRLIAQLEKILVSPLQVDYPDQLMQARARLREQMGGAPKLD